MNAKLEANQKMVGKIILVLNHESNEKPWRGLVKGVKDEETLLVEFEGAPIEVSIFDVRSL